MRHAKASRQASAAPPPPAVYSNQHITLASAEFTSAQAIELRWHGLPGGATVKGDWITVVPAGSADTDWGNWWYTGGQQSGVRDLGRLAPGQYEVRVYFNWPSGGYNVHSRLPFTVRSAD